MKERKVYKNAMVTSKLAKSDVLMANALSEESVIECVYALLKDAGVDTSTLKGKYKLEYEINTYTKFTFKCGHSVSIKDSSYADSAGFTPILFAYFDTENEQDFEQEIITPGLVYDYEIEEAYENFDVWKRDYEDLGIFLIHVQYEKYINKNCLKCEVLRGYKSPHIGLMSHGISAFHKAANFYELFTRIKEIESHGEWEICTSNVTNNIGNIGVWGLGNIIASFKYDIRSYKYEDGHRDFSPNNYDSYIYYTKRHDRIAVIRNLRKYLLRDEVSGYNSDYTNHAEHWVKDFKPVAVWCKRHWFNRLPKCKQKILKFFCDKHRLQLVLVGKQGEIGYEVVS